MRMWLGILLLLFAAPAGAATYFAVGTGNWSATSTWSLTSGGTTGVGPPGVGDIAKLDGNTGTVTLNVDVTVQSVLSDTGATLATTTLNLSTHTLTIDTGTLNNGTPTFADEFTIVPGTSTVVCNGGSLAPHGQPLYDITITGSCNFGRTESAHDVTIAAGATLNLEAIGSPARFYVFNSLIGTAGSALGTWNPGGLAPKLIATQQVNLTGFTVTGINCQGTVPCLADATSTDGGGNTNWCFGAGCSSATYTPTPVPTMTPTVTPTATPNVTPGCGAISTNPSGLTCLDAAMETAAGLDCSLIVVGGSPQGTEACCIDIAAFNSYCTGDTGTTCTGDGDCVGTGPCVIVTCTFTSGGACSPATFPDGAIGGACVAGATETPTATPTVTPTATGPTPTPGITPGCCALVGAPAPTTCLDNAWFAGHPELGVSTVASLSDCQAQSVILYAGQDFVTAYNAVNCVNGTAPDHTDGRCGPVPPTPTTGPTPPCYPQSWQEWMGFPKPTPPSSAFHEWGKL